MPAPPLEEMRIVASRLKPLNVPFAFVGGAVTCLLVDHPELTDFRRTNDVDVVVAAITYFEFAALEARLREAEFLGRFFRSQFKRSVAVNGTKVGSGGSLSPRGDWRAPSGAEARAWLDEA